MFMAAYAVGDQRINDGLWERTSEMMRMDCRRDADAVIAAHLQALGAGGHVVVQLPEPVELPRFQESVGRSPNPLWSSTSGVR